jgi:hypothetical protein
MALNPLPKPSHCENSTTHIHSLDCGHNVITSPIAGLYTSASSPKQSCSPNCYHTIHAAKPQLPLHWLKTSQTLHEQSFICPACVENQIREQYPKSLEQHRKERGRLTDSEETNVQLWTYAAVLEAVERGGRMCEATVGLFRLKYVDGFKALADRKMAVSILNEIAEGKRLTGGQGEDKKWEMRGGKDDGEEMEGKEKEERELALEEDASKIASVAAKKGVVEEEDVDMEMDDLADRLFDAKVGVVEGDQAVDDLMVGLSRL